MTDDKKPATEVKESPRLLSIRFPAALTLSGITPTLGVTIGDGPGAWPADRVLVVGDSLFLHAPGADTVVEVVRSSCVLRWGIGTMTLGDAVGSIRKGGR